MGILRNFSQMPKGEESCKDLAQQFLENPIIAMKHLKDGYMPDGIEKFQFPIPEDFIQALPDPPEHSASAKYKWACFMACQVVSHQIIGGCSGVGSSQPYEVAAWHLASDRHEAMLGKNKMKKIDEEIRTSVGLDGLVKADVVKTLNRKRELLTGMAFLNDSRTAVLTGHQLSSLKYGDAIELKVTARNDAVSVADTVAVPLKWFDEQGENDSDVNDFGMANLKTPLYGLPFLNCMTTPDTSTSPDGKLRGAVFGHPELFPELRYASMDFKFDLGGPVNIIRHDGNTVEGNSGSPIVMGRHVVGIHSSWDWLDKEQTEKINVATPINHFGNDIKVFRQILDYMAVEPTLYWTLKKDSSRDIKFLATKAGGIAEVKVVGPFDGEVGAVRFEWHEV